MDIPDDFIDIRKYNATMAHKTNHSFHPNVVAYKVSFDHIFTVLKNWESLKKKCLGNGHVIGID